jgi:hypothetical protein
VPSLGQPDLLSDVFRRFLHGRPDRERGGGGPRVAASAEAAPFGLSQETTVFEQLMQNGKKFWIHNFSEPLRGGRFRGSVLRREVWLEIDAVEKALPY